MARKHGFCLMPSKKRNYHYDILITCISNRYLITDIRQVYFPHFFLTIY